MFEKCSELIFYLKKSIFYLFLRNVDPLASDCVRKVRLCVSLFDVKRQHIAPYIKAVDPAYVEPD